MPRTGPPPEGAPVASPPAGAPPTPPGRGALSPPLSPQAPPGAAAAATAVLHHSAVLRHGLRRPSAVLRHGLRQRRQLAEQLRRGGALPGRGAHAAAAQRPHAGVHVERPLQGAAVGAHLHGHLQVAQARPGAAAGGLREGVWGGGGSSLEAPNQPVRPGGTRGRGPSKGPTPHRPQKQNSTTRQLRTQERWLDDLKSLIAPSAREALRSCRCRPPWTAPTRAAPLRAGEGWVGRVGWEGVRLWARL